MTSPLDDAADALPASDKIFGLSMDPTWRVVHRYRPTTEEGREVIVSVARMPARFWRIQCPDLELDLATGSASGMPELADAIADAIADGMLGPGFDR